MQFATVLGGAKDNVKTVAIRYDSRMREPEGRPQSLLELPSYVAGQVSRFGRRHLAQVLERHDLQLVHYAILTALHDLGPQSQQDIANVLDLDKSHLVARIDLLERRRLVRRAQDPSDRRRHRVTLTPAGRRLVNTLRPAAARSQESLLDSLSETEQRTLMSLLRRVLAANDANRLGNTGAPQPPHTDDDDQAPTI